MSGVTAVSPTGLLVIDKPLGWSSMDVCRNVRRRLVRGGAPKRVKVGHGGTLDPLATGVLVILVGKATPLCDVIMAGEKGYTGIVRLGATSETDDGEGPITRVASSVVVTREMVESAVSTHFVGRVMQTPPAHSAMKIGGQRAYKLAREGKRPVMSPRPVEIHSVAVVGFEVAGGGDDGDGLVSVTLEIRCGKGTYIRSLARDLGDRLGVGGYLGGLVRTRVGRFTIGDAVHPDTLPEVMTQADLLAVPEDLVVGGGRVGVE